MLLEDYRDCPGVSSYHMACRSDPDHPDKIKFLYKFKKGECPKSFGMNVALMSGLDRSIINRAKQKSEEFDKRMSELSKNCSANKYYKELYQQQTWSQCSSQQSVYGTNLQPTFYMADKYGDKAKILVVPKEEVNLITSEAMTTPTKNLS